MIQGIRRASQLPPYTPFQTIAWWWPDFLLLMFNHLNWHRKHKNHPSGHSESLRASWKSKRPIFTLIELLEWVLGWQLQLEFSNMVWLRECASAPRPFSLSDRHFCSTSYVPSSSGNKS
jgi:hypothetical protein